MGENTLKVTLLVTIMLIILSACNKSGQKQLEAIQIEVKALFNDNKDDLAEGVTEELLKAVHDQLKDICTAEGELSAENERT